MSTPELLLTPLPSLIPVFPISMNGSEEHYQTKCSGEMCFCPLKVVFSPETILYCIFISVNLAKNLAQAIIQSEIVPRYSTSMGFGLPEEIFLSFKIQL